MKRVVFLNQKGGVGKTTSALHMTWRLAELGKKVLGIDLDPQGNYSSSMGLSSCTMADVLFPRDGVPALRPEAIDFNGSTIEVLSSNNTLKRMHSGEDETRYRMLKRALREAGDRWDYVVMDCPPFLGYQTSNALHAGEWVVIPLKPGEYELAGLRDMMQIIESYVEEDLNRSLKVAGILINDFEMIGRTSPRIARECVKEILRVYPEQTFSDVIPHAVGIQEAVNARMPVWRHAPGTRAAESYLAFTASLIARIEEKGGIDGRSEEAA